MSTTAPYGSWPSPITAADVATASTRLDGARFVGEEIWWAEGVPAEGGRMAVRRRDAQGRVSDVITAPWNARSRVHEYGGGAWCADDDGTLVFVEASDQRAYLLAPGAQPIALTEPEAGVALGGLTYQHGRVLAVREHTTDAGTRHAIVEIALDGSGTRTIAEGSDFVAQPALSPDGAHLAWIAWNHPDMPWDRASLRIGRLVDGAVAEVVDASPGESAALQPQWLDTETVLFSDDATGRWNLVRYDLATGTSRPIAPADADTGGALWTLGMRWFAPLADGRVLAVRTQGSDELVIIDPAVGAASPVDAQVSSDTFVEDVRGSLALVVSAAPTQPLALWLIDLDGGAEPVRLVGDDVSALRPWLPEPRMLTAPGPHGPVHAVVYPPRNPEIEAASDELAPYVVWVHGGPTAHVGPTASRKIAYFTSRGIGVLDVNYGGSTGYGRAYRERLRGQWGVVDVEDVSAAAAGLAEAGLADPSRLAIAGGSAGGWTVLSALTAGDVFAAGISRYGVGDARALAADTHDFEARYLDGLIGALPEAEELYVSRSPLTHADRFRVPLLILQGEDDRVVPPAQSEAIRDALRERGVPHAYVLYPGEGHGFRRRETTIDALQNELAFLGEVFGFAPDVPALPLSVGALHVAAEGPEVRIDPAAPTTHAARDLAVVVSREPVRPLFARTADAAWAEVLREAGFTAVDGEHELFVLPPTLDGD